MITFTRYFEVVGLQLFWIKRPTATSSQLSFYFLYSALTTKVLKCSVVSSIKIKASLTSQYFLSLLEFSDMKTCQRIKMCVRVMCVFHSRHDNDTEVEPVPGVPQEGERPHTETPRQDLYERLECVDTCEGIPG